MLAGLDVTIMSVHLRTLLQKRGFSLAEAAALGALIGPAQVTGRIGEMMSGGRYHPFWPLAIATALGAIGMKGNRPDIGSSVFSGTGLSWMLSCPRCGSRKHNSTGLALRNGGEYPPATITRMYGRLAPAALAMHSGSGPKFPDAFTAMLDEKRVSN